jgi:hypothetical protein
MVLLLLVGLGHYRRESPTLLGGVEEWAVDVTLASEVCVYAG